MEGRPRRELRVERGFETSRLENDLLAVAYDRAIAHRLHIAHLTQRVDPETASVADAGVLVPLMAKGA